MIVSIEIPVIRGGWLMQCIDSVLQQTSPNWRLSLYWDRGDALSETILEELDKIGSPRIQIHFGRSRLGIARARQFLTQRSYGDLILPLDDDDILLPAAVERFLQVATEYPWSGIIRARREFIGEEGEPVLMKDWFPFERRKYFKGATADVANHSQPYIIRRKQFMEAGGWTGFSDFEFLGEDCGCFTKIEETSEVELLDEILYQYRIHKERTSLRFDESDADEMWRRIADETIRRRKATVRRDNEKPPFRFVPVKTDHPRPAAVDVVIPFWETNEKELKYDCSRPAAVSSLLLLRVDTHFSQYFKPPIGGFSRMEIAVTTTGSVHGSLCVALFRPASFSPGIVLTSRIESFEPYDLEFISFHDPGECCAGGGFTRMEITFEPVAGSRDHSLFLHIVESDNSTDALIRFFGSHPGFCRERLDRCISSALAAGISKEAIHIIEKKQSSAANRNEGFKNCSRPWICMMDDDAELATPGTLQEMLDCMVKFDAALCGPKLLTPSGHIYSGTPYTDPVMLEARVGGMGEPDCGQFDVNTLVSWLPSTVLVAHVSVILSTGGFDENFKGSQHEDIDFCLRARSRGFTCCYAGKTTAIHHNMLRNGHFTKNMLYLKNRWRNRKDLFTWQGNDLPAGKKR